MWVSNSLRCNGASAECHHRREEPRLIQHEDDDVSAASETSDARRHRRPLQRQVHQPGDRRARVAVSVDCVEGEPSCRRGRTFSSRSAAPKHRDIGFDRAGVLTDARGYVTVDEHLSTNVPGYGPPASATATGAFTPTAYNDFEIVAANLARPVNRGACATAYPLRALTPIPRSGRWMTRRGGARRSALPDRARAPMSKVGRPSKRGNARLHESCRRRGNQKKFSAPHPRHWWRRSDPWRARHHDAGVPYDVLDARYPNPTQAGIDELVKKLG